MPSVEVLLSSYNGERTLDRQIQSILTQKFVRVTILVRDDGSTDKSMQILRDLSKKHPNQIKVIAGENLGWRESFKELIRHASDSDYYAFSDQDDIWFSAKLHKSIQAISTNLSVPKLVHVQSLEVDEKLLPLPNQQLKIDKPASFEMAVVTEIFQGCSMVWNASLMRILQNNLPTSPEIPHDFWVGLVAYITGKIYFIPEPLFYHIRYAENSSTDGNVFKGRMSRVKKALFSSQAYLNPTHDLLNSTITLSEDQKSFLTLLNQYRSRVGLRLKLLVNRKFRRPSLLSTVLLKMEIIFGKY